MRDAVSDGSDGEEPDGEKRPSMAGVKAERRADPDPNPTYVEDDEEAGGPRRQPEHRWKPLKETRRVFFGEVQTLEQHARNKESSRAAPIIGSRCNRNAKQRKKQGRNCGDAESRSTKQLTLNALVH
jgi:hypothetical protein